MEYTNIYLNNMNRIWKFIIFDFFKFIPIKGEIIYHAITTRIIYHKINNLRWK